MPANSELLLLRRMDDKPLDGEPELALSRVSWTPFLSSSLSNRCSNAASSLSISLSNSSFIFWLTYLCWDDVTP